MQSNFVALAGRVCYKLNCARGAAQHRYHSYTVGVRHETIGTEKVKLLFWLGPKSEEPLDSETVRGL